MGFHAVEKDEDLSIDVSITIVALILTKLGWFQHFSTSQNSISTLFEKKNQIFGFLCCSNREDLTIDVWITTVGLILTKLRWSFFFCRGTDISRGTDRQTRFRNPHMETYLHTKISIQSLKLGVSCRSLIFED